MRSISRRRRSTRRRCSRVGITTDSFYGTRAAVQRRFHRISLASGFDVVAIRSASVPRSRLGGGQSSWSTFLPESRRRKHWSNNGAQTFVRLPRPMGRTRRAPTRADGSYARHDRSTRRVRNSRRSPRRSRRRSSRTHGRLGCVLRCRFLVRVHNITISFGTRDATGWPPLPIAIVGPERRSKRPTPLAFLHAGPALRKESNARQRRACRSLARAPSGGSQRSGRRRNAIVETCDAPRYGARNRRDAGANIVHRSEIRIGMRAVNGHDRCRTTTIHGAE